MHSSYCEYKLITTKASFRVKNPVLQGLKLKRQLFQDVLLFAFLLVDEKISATLVSLAQRREAEENSSTIQINNSFHSFYSDKLSVGCKTPGRRRDVEVNNLNNQNNFMMVGIERWMDLSARTQISFCQMHK